MRRSPDTIPEIPGRHAARSSHRERPRPSASSGSWCPIPGSIAALTPDVAAGWEAFLAALAGAGVTIVDLDVPEIDFPGMVSEAMYPEVAAVHRRRYVEHPDGYGPEVRRRVESAVRAEIDPYLEGLAWRYRMREAAIAALADADAMITPPVAALRKLIGVDTIEVGGETVSYRGPLSCFSALVNHMGLPALVLPIDTEGSPPPSAQLIGRPWGEHRLLEAGLALEAAGISGVRTPPQFRPDGR